VIISGLLTCGQPVVADPGDWTDAGSDPTPGVIDARAGEEISGGPGESRSAPSQPRCRWELFDWAGSQIPGAPPSGPAIRDATTGELVSAAGPNTETGYWRYCPGEAPAFLWVPDGVDEDELIDSAFDRVSALLPEPAVDMNPDPSVGGIVNIGLWLAVQDPGQVSITASVGPVWATVTARYERTGWDLGNGDQVECEGVGTPIVDWDTVEQGPCGYTYRWPSAPKFTGTDDLAYHASVTGHWVVTYATSSGRSGSLTPIARTTAFAYQVREIQTLRVAGDG
jgi:hypothetical protein